MSKMFVILFVAIAAIAISEVNSQGVLDVLGVIANPIENGVGLVLPVGNSGPLGDLLKKVLALVGGLLKLVLTGNVVDLQNILDRLSPVTDILGGLGIVNLSDLGDLGASGILGALVARVLVVIGGLLNLILTQNIAILQNVLGRLGPVTDILEGLGIDIS